MSSLAQVQAPYICSYNYAGCPWPTRATAITKLTIRFALRSRAMSLIPSIAELPSMLPPNSVTVAPGPPFAVGAHGQVTARAQNLCNMTPDWPSLSF
jgi:hypothetical protein